MQCYIGDGWLIVVLGRMIYQSMPSSLRKLVRDVGRFIYPSTSSHGNLNCPSEKKSLLEEDFPRDLGLKQLPVVNSPIVQGTMAFRLLAVFLLLALSKLSWSYPKSYSTSSSTAIIRD